MAKQYWLMKSEPDAYSWDDLVAEEGRHVGRRAQPHRCDQPARDEGGRRGFFLPQQYRLEVVGIMTISQEHFIDPTDEKARFVAVKVKPVRKIANPVTLKAIKANPKLADMQLIRQSRLSVAPVSAAEWKEILKMAGE